MQILFKIINLLKNNYVFHKISRQDKYQLQHKAFFSNISPPWGYRNSFVNIVKKYSNIARDSDVLIMLPKCCSCLVGDVASSAKRNFFAVHGSEVCKTCI